MIDRIIPKFFSSDQDERLGAAGMMTEALNVTIANMGEGSESILKNMKGTSGVTASTGADKVGDDDYFIVGQVTDDALGRIYVFMFCNDRDESGIYYVDTEGASSYDNISYKVVLKSTYFNFTKDSFVKADIVKGTFLSSSSEQTVIYFTDGENPPRKINIDRALSGDYEAGTSDTFERLVSTIKGSSNLAPTFTVGTDTSREINNINDNLFQFATQIIYNDGEESALSPYSGVAIARPTYLDSLEEAGYGVQNYVDNFIEVTHNVNFEGIPDVSKIRILCRSSNTASWFVADEYDPAVGVSAQLDGTGTATVLAGENSASYKFYADTLGSLVSPTVTTKQYDNVPLKAKGQAVVRDRLIYSNYTEGFANVDCTGAKLSIAYSDESNSFVEYITSGEIAGVFGTTASNTHLTFDFSTAGLTSGSQIIPGGTKAVLDFDYRPNHTVSGTDLYRARIFDFTQEPSPGDDFASGVVTYNNILFEDISGSTAPANVRIVDTNSQDGTLNNFIEQIASNFLDKEVILRYDASGTTYSATSGNISGTSIGLDSEWEATFKFDDYSISGLEITVKPYLSDLVLIGTDGDLVVDQGVFLVDSDEYSDLTYSDTDDPMSNEFASMSTLILTNTLKAGSSHSFGIVYYDKFGRHGFVNKIGSVDALYPSKRSDSDDKGSATAYIELTDKTAGNHITLPSWADSWQVVYGEPNTIFDSFQYTVGGAFVPVNKDDNTIDLNNQKVYVSLKTLDAYRSEKGVNRDYSFTEGDKLRVIKHRSSTDTAWKYPTSNLDSNFGGDDSTYDYTQSLIEFDVCGVEILSGDDQDSNPLMASTGVVTYTNAQKKKYDGTFVVLESTQINTGVEVTIDSTDHPLMYDGFDWQNVAKKQATDASQSVDITYNDTSGTTLSAADNKWRQQCLVDIVTPRKRTSEQVYYEVGVGGKCYPSLNGTTYPNHGPYFVGVNQTNHYLRPVACKTPEYDSGWNYDEPDDWIYKTMFIEDDSVTDRIVSNSWNKGKAHAIYEKAKEVERPYSITWSDRYNVDVETLTLSSFNSAQVNYANYANRYGDINYISNYDENLLALQENKASIAPVSKAVFNQAAGGDGVVSLSTNVVEEGSINYYSGDWGCTTNPESVLIYDTQVFFADSSRGKIVRITREGLSPISDNGLQSLFADKFRAHNYDTGTTVAKKVLSGYDPDDDYYYVTIKSDSAQNTYAYSARQGVWISEASFIPDMYSRMNDTMYSFKYISSGSGFAWKHSNTASRNTYYGTGYGSKVSAVSKYNPSMVKIYRAIGINGGTAHDTRIVSSIGNDTGSGVMPAASYVLREGQHYREIPGDTTSTDSQNYFGIGAAESGSGTTLTMKKLRGIQVPVGGIIQYDNGGTLTDAGSSGAVTVVSVDHANNTITASGTLTASVANNDIFIITGGSVDGARIRGHYSTVTLENSSTSPWELYSIDLNFENSRPNYALGQ